MGERIILSGDEAHHLLNVVRVRMGEDVILFDGKGGEAAARLVSGRRREASLEILSTAEPDREPLRELTIACALPRSTRMNWLVEKCSELGVARLVPMITARSVVKPGPRENNQIRRWHTTAIESAKQCGRVHLMEITSVLPYAAVFDMAVGADFRVAASPEPDAVPLAQAAQELSGKASAFALIGPEGGLTEDEVRLAREVGCEVVSLGRLILRVETAAVAMAAILLADARD